MEILFDTAGSGKAIYDEKLDLAVLGSVKMKRVSQVNPDENNKWWADLGIIYGPKLGPFDKYSQAVAAEVAWLRENYLAGPQAAPKINRYFTPEQYKIIRSAWRFTSAQVRQHRDSYISYYRVIWAYTEGRKRVAVMEIGPYKCNRKSSIYYTPELEQEARDACRKEAQQLIAELKQMRKEELENRANIRREQTRSRLGSLESGACSSTTG